MFSIRIVTPVVTDENGHRHAAGLLTVGPACVPFFLDCAHWSASDYERQWKDGIHRLAEGARSSLLLTAYRGDCDVPHTLWAMWRDHDHVYVQARSVRSSTLAEPFDPWDAYACIPPRMPVGEYAPPPTQCRLELEAFLTSAAGLRVPFYSR